MFNWKDYDFVSFWTVSPHFFFHRFDLWPLPLCHLKPAEGVLQQMGIPPKFHPLEPPTVDYSLFQYIWLHSTLHQKSEKQWLGGGGGGVHLFLMTADTLWSSGSSLGGVNALGILRHPKPIVCLSPPWWTHICISTTVGSQPLAPNDAVGSSTRSVLAIGGRPAFYSPSAFTDCAIWEL